MRHDFLLIIIFLNWIGFFVLSWVGFAFLLMRWIRMGFFYLFYHLLGIGIGERLIFFSFHFNLSLYLFA